MAAREGRRSRGTMALFIACIAVGVAAIVVVAGITQSVASGVVAEGRRLLAADVAVEGRRPAPGVLDELLERFDPGIHRSDLREFVSIVLGPQGSSSLVEVKVVEPGYPWYGQLVLEPGQPLMGQLADDAIVVAPELLARLGAQVGDVLVLGGQPMRVAGVVREEPDKLTISFTLGPRVFMNEAALSRTSLLDRGARVNYRAMLKLPADASPGAAARLKEYLEANLPDAAYYRVRTYAQAQPALRRGFDRIGRYLGLVGLLSLLIGSLGVAQVSRVWLASRMRDVAVLRCLGVTSRQVLGIFALQMMALSLTASVVGVLAGGLLLWVLPWLASDYLPVDLLESWQPWAMLRGVAMGLGVAMVAVLPVLLAAGRVSPVRVLREDHQSPRGLRRWQGLMLLAAGGAIWLAAWVQAESFEQASWFTAGLAGVALGLWGCAAGVSGLVKLLPRQLTWLGRVGLAMHVRHGLAHLARPGAATISAIVAVGLGVSFLFATHLVESRLSGQLSLELPDNAPSTFFVDVQPDQWPGLEKLLQDRGATHTRSQPLVTARIAAIDGVAVAQLLEGDAASSSNEPDANDRSSRPRRWALTREQRITYGSELPQGNEVIQGRFTSKTDETLDGKTSGGGVSVEEEFANDIGVGVGSVITLDVQGVMVDLPVTSLRRVDWRTFGINFFLFAEEGPLDDAPQMRVATARLPGGQVDDIQLAVVQAYPNVTLIHIREVIDKVLGVLSSLALAVRGLGLFTLTAGAIVLGGTIAATQARRSREVALLKTIGMKRSDVLLVYGIEYALTGSVAAIVGVLAGTLLAWGMLSHVMELPWQTPWLAMAVAVVLTSVLAVVIGLASSARALASKPIGLLSGG